jgi:hypothetical protein
MVLDLERLLSPTENKRLFIPKQVVVGNRRFISRIYVPKQAVPFLQETTIRERENSRKGTKQEPK